MYLFFLFQKPSSRLEEDGTLAELAVDTPEHPSPISVLDTSLYRDDAMSPVNQIQNLATGKCFAVWKNWLYVVDLKYTQSNIE